MRGHLRKVVRAVGLVAVLALGGACSPPKPSLEVGVREVPTDVVIGTRSVGPEQAPAATTTTTTVVAPPAGVPGAPAPGPAAPAPVAPTPVAPAPGPDVPAPFPSPTPEDLSP